MTTTTITTELAIEKARRVHKRSKSGMMKSIRIHTYGNTDVLKMEEAAIPMPAADEVLIKVHACGVNPIDWKLREGYMHDSMPVLFPFIPGCDVAGTVVSTGLLVVSFEEGDMVFAQAEISRSGCYAEYVTVKAGEVAFAPDSISLTYAAVVPLASQTAWVGLFEVGKLKFGQKILIQGCGGVGLYAIQLAKLAGAYVIASSGNPDEEFLKTLGVDELIDLKNEKKWEDLKNVDLIFDTMGGESQEILWKTLRKNGMLVSTVGVDEDKAKKYEVSGKSFVCNSNGARLQEIAGLIDKNLLKVHIAHELRLEDAAKAHELSQTRKSKGKIVLLINSKNK